MQKDYLSLIVFTDIYIYIYIYIYIFSFFGIRAYWDLGGNCVFRLQNPRLNGVSPV